MGFEDDLLDKLLLASLLNKLPEEDKELLIMYYWDDYSLEEIGGVWGEKYRGRVLKEGTIRYHLKRIAIVLRSWT